MDERDIIFEGKKRYYLEDLTVKDYSLENTTPHKLLIEDYEIDESGWGELLRSTVMILLSLFPDKKKDLTNFTCSWSKTCIFSNVSKINYKQIDDDIYLNCNHTALHSCWLLQELLDFFNVDKSKVKLIIHRPSGAESKEIQSYIKTRTKKEFVSFLQYNYGKTEEYALSVVKNIESSLDKVLCSISKSYISFFLFDDYTAFCKYAKDVQEKYDKNYDISDKTKKIVSKYIGFLKEYYKI